MLNLQRQTLPGVVQGEAWEESDAGSSGIMATQEGVRVSSQGMTAYPVSFIQLLTDLVT